MLLGTLFNAIVVQNGPPRAPEAAHGTHRCAELQMQKVTSGHFTNFDLVIDKFAQAAPQSRGTFLFDNGSKKSEGEFSNGMRINNWVYYNEDGTTKEEKNFLQ